MRSHTTWRRRLLPVLDRVLGSVGLYAAYELHPEEFVGAIRLPRGVDAVREYLLERGYERSRLAALKHHPETAATEDASLRRVDPDRPRRQWHVHLFARGDGVVELFSHYEYRPDPRPLADESARQCLERLREHYRPEWGTTWGGGTTYAVGRTDGPVRRLVE
jgi:hypothetical protein